MARPVQLRQSVLRSIQGPNLLGNLAIALGFLTQGQLEDALRKQAAAAAPRPRLGDVLVSCGHLSPTQIETLLDLQEAATSVSADSRIGQIALQNGFLTAAQLAEAVRLQRDSGGRRLGEVLVERGFLDAARLDVLLAAQRRVQAEQARIARRLAINDFGLNDGEEWTVGRSEENHVVLPDPDVAKRHARIYVRNGHYLVEDLGSLSGTWVDGGRITGPTVLEPGATMVFGNTVLQFTSRPAATTSTPRSCDTRLIVRRRHAAQSGGLAPVLSVAAILVLVGGMGIYLHGKQTAQPRTVAKTPEPEVQQPSLPPPSVPKPTPAAPAPPEVEDPLEAGFLPKPPRAAEPEAPSPPSVAGPAEVVLPPEVVEPEGPKEEEALAELVARTGQGSEDSRRQAVVELIALGDRGAAEALRVLRAWRGAAWRELCTPAEAALSRRASAYARELFDLRVAAILKISDQEAYTKHDGQAEVDRRVAEVRKFLKKNRDVDLPRLPAAQRERLLRMEWIDARLTELGDSPIPVPETIRLRRDGTLSIGEYRLPYEPARSPRRDAEVEAQNLKMKGQVLKEEWDLLVELNEYRAVMGRPLLRLDPALCKAARTHSEWMCEAAAMDHAEPEQTRRDPSTRARLYGYVGGIGENILMGLTTGKDSHEAWYKSAPHHRNMLMLWWEDVGVGRCQGCWTEVFGSRHPRQTRSGGK